MLTSLSAPSLPPNGGLALPSLAQATSSTLSSKSSNEEQVAVYTGSKLFWKAPRCNVDFNFILYPKLNCIELCAFNADDHIESERIYCDAEKLLAKISDWEVEEKCNKKQEELVRKRQARIATDELSIQVRRELVGPYLLMRIAVDPNKTEEEPFKIMINSLMNDNIDFIIDKPDCLNAQFIARRRKTNAHEFHSALASFQADSKVLSDASNKASRMAGLAKSSVEGLNSVLKKKVVYDPSTMSMAKFRWKKACSRVVVNNYISAVRVRLEKMEKMATRNSFDSSSLTSAANNADSDINSRLSRGTFPLPDRGITFKSASFLPSLPAITSPRDHNETENSASGDQSESGAAKPLLRQKTGSTKTPSSGQANSSTKSTKQAAPVAKSTSSKLPSVKANRPK